MRIGVPGPCAALNASSVNGTAAALAAAALDSPAAVKAMAMMVPLNNLRVKIMVKSFLARAPKLLPSIVNAAGRATLIRARPHQCYLTTPEVNPAFRRGGLISFFRKQWASLPT